MHINAGLLFDLPHLDQSGADGIGLFRTELQFMISATFPRLEQQTRLYKAILDAAGDRPVVFRSLDVGGDKVLPYFRLSPEENPALGWRAIRMALDRPALFRTQIRALLRAAAGRELRIMLPMIADVSEFRAAPRADRPRSDAAQAAWTPGAEDAHGRRHDRGAGAAVATRSHPAVGRFRLGRLERL